VAIVFVDGPAQHDRDAARLLERGLGPRLGDWARVVIAGQCSRARPAGNGGSAVRQLGYVEDLRGLYAAADIAANPVPYGSRSSVKVAEYLAAGLPVVSTPGGNARLRASPVPAVREPTWTELGRRLHDAYARLLGGAAPPAVAP